MRMTKKATTMVTVVLIGVLVLSMLTSSPLSVYARKDYKTGDYWKGFVKGARLD